MFLLSKIKIIKKEHASHPPPSCCCSLQQYKVAGYAQANNHSHTWILTVIAVHIHNTFTHTENLYTAVGTSSYTMNYPNNATYIEYTVCRHVHVL